MCGSWETLNKSANVIMVKQNMQAGMFCLLRDIVESTEEFPSNDENV